MSNTVKGLVEDIKEFASSRGPMYSIKVGGEFFGTGSAKPKVSKGDLVSLTWTENGKYKNADAKSIQVLKNEEAPATASRLPPASAASASGDARQEVISRQSALNSAIDFVAILASVDALPGVGKTTKPEDKFALVEALVAKKQAEFYAGSTGKEYVEYSSPKVPAARDAGARPAAVEDDGAWQ